VSSMTKRERREARARASWGGNQKKSAPPIPPLSAGTKRRVVQET